MSSFQQDIIKSEHEKDCKEFALTAGETEHITETMDQKISGPALYGL